jgi:hypothetical protein
MKHLLWRLLAITTITQSFVAVWLSDTSISRIISFDTVIVLSSTWVATVTENIQLPSDLSISEWFSRSIYKKNFDWFGRTINILSVNWDPIKTWMVVETSDYISIELSPWYDATSVTLQYEIYNWIIPNKPSEKWFFSDDVKWEEQSFKFHPIQPYDNTIIGSASVTVIVPPGMNSEQYIVNKNNFAVYHWLINSEDPTGKLDDLVFDEPTIVKEPNGNTSYKVVFSQQMWLGRVGIVYMVFPGQYFSLPSWYDQYFTPEFRYLTPEFRYLTIAQYDQLQRENESFFQRLQARLEAKQSAVATGQDSWWAPVPRETYADQEGEENTTTIEWESTENPTDNLVYIWDDIVNMWSGRNWSMPSWKVSSSLWIPIYLFIAIAVVWMIYKVVHTTIAHKEIWSQNTKPHSDEDTKESLKM